MNWDVQNFLYARQWLKALYTQINSDILANETYFQDYLDI